MNDAAKYAQGWDAKAIQKVAKNRYGNYTGLFEAHGWPERGAQMMPVVQERVAEAYGSVRAFERAHDLHGLMDPLKAIYSDPPNVWLTSLYGFRPEGWGLLGFTNEGHRQKFIQNSEPGVLVVVYGAAKSSAAHYRNVIGILACSHRLGHSRRFMALHEWEAKKHDKERAGKWNFAVKVTRAWRVTPETRMHVEAFAPQATSTGAWLHIGARGVQLSKKEALNILRLDLQEAEVYGEDPIVGAMPGSAEEVLSPSQAGPVSQSPFVSREAEGPKHLYVLRLHGDTDAFLGESSGGRLVVKVGFSRSPGTRCDDHNHALPRCAFRWSVLHAGALSGYDPHPTSAHAKAGEEAMKEFLYRSPSGESLGGEFFLANKRLIKEAWNKGNQAAKDYKK